MKGLCHLEIIILYVREWYHFNEEKNVAQTETIKSPKVV